MTRGSAARFAERLRPSLEFLHFGRGGHLFSRQAMLLGKAVDEPTVGEFENLLAQLFVAGSLASQGFLRF
jgi:hypothetical protein